MRRNTGGLEGAARSLWRGTLRGVLSACDLVCVRVRAVTGTIQTVQKVAAMDGVFALWNGFLPYYGRCGGHTVTMFVAVDQIRTLYQKMV